MKNVSLIGIVLIISAMAARLFAINGFKVKELPRINHSSAGRIDLEKVGEFLYKLAASGVALPKTTAPLMKYAERLFSRPAFIEALTPSEKVMRK